MSPQAESSSDAVPGSAGPPSDQAIAALLRSARTIAVVGLSPKPFRASYGVSEFLQSAGYRIIPVNPGIREVLGEKAYASLEDVPKKSISWTYSGAPMRCLKLWTRRSASARAPCGCRRAL